MSLRAKEVTLDSQGGLGRTGKRHLTHSDESKDLMDNCILCLGHSLVSSFVSTAAQAVVGLYPQVSLYNVYNHLHPQLEHEVSLKNSH